MSLPQVSRISISQAQVEWDHFKGQAADYEAWHSSVFGLVPGERKNFDSGGRSGYVECKEDGLKNMRYIEDNADDVDAEDFEEFTYGCIEENDLPDGSIVATFTFGGKETGWQWQKVVLPGGNSCLFGPVIKQRSLVSSSHCQQESGLQQSGIPRVAALGHSYIPRPIDSSAIDKDLFKPDPSLLDKVDGFTRFTDRTNGEKTGFIMPIEDIGTEGWWANPDDTVGGSWKDYLEVGDDCNPRLCKQTCYTSERRCTVHQQKIGEAMDSSGYFSVQ